MNKFLIYALLSLLGTSSLFAYLSYHFYGEKQIAIASLSQAKQINLELGNAIKMKESSCKIDDESVAQVEEEKKELETRIQSLTKQIADLNKKGPLVKKPITVEATNNVEKSNVLAGDELLNDELTRLLQSTFCEAEPNDLSCSAKQPSN